MFLVIACSIINKIDELVGHLYAFRLDMMVITESWAREDISDVELSIDDFVIFCNDRKICVCGGCILYIKNCYNATLVEDLGNVPDPETVWCKLILSNMPILISVCYYNTSAMVVNEIVLHSIIRKTCSMNNYVICGYFNHSSIDLNTLHAGSESQEFFDLNLDCFLIQHIREPT